jgi:hypothetical protein
VARLIEISQREVPKQLHQDSRYREVQNPDRGDGMLRGQSRVCVRVSAYRDSGVREPSFSTSRVSKSR